MSDFYAGVLHPFLVPAEALALIAIGLLVGHSGHKPARLAVLVLPLGLIIGFASANLLPGEWMMTTYLLALTLVAASIVVAAVRPPLAVVVVLTLATSIGLGLDAFPGVHANRAMVTAAAGTLLAATISVTMIAGLIVGRDKFWQLVAIRVAGSWLTASALLYLASRFANL